LALMLFEFLVALACVDEWYRWEGAGQRHPS